MHPAVVLLFSQIFDIEDLVSIRALRRKRGYSGLVRFNWELEYIEESGLEVYVLVVHG